MNSRSIVGIGLGLYYGIFVLAALLGLPRLVTYVAASGLGAVTVGYAFYSSGWRIPRELFVRWQCLIVTFLTIVGISYAINIESYDISLSLKVVGYVSLFGISTLVALATGRESANACLHTYLVCLLFSIVVTLAVNNTNSHNLRLLGPSYQEGVAGSGLHHNEVGLLGMTAVMLATARGWRTVLFVTPLALYTAYLAGSRGAMLGIVLAVTVYATAGELATRSALRGLSVVPRRAIFIAAGITGLCMAIAVFGGSFLLDDVLQLTSEKRGLASGFTGRWDAWSGMVNNWLASPIVGRGYGIVRGEALAKGVAADGGYLLLTAELGAAGMLLFLFLIVAALKSSWAGVTKIGDRQSVTILVFVLTFCFINIFESRFVGTGSIGLGMFIYFSSLCTLSPLTQTGVAYHSMTQDGTIFPGQHSQRTLS